MIYNPNKNICSVDFSLNGSAIIIGNTDSNKIDYKYFSNLKSDLGNENCIPIPDGISGTEKLDNVICHFLSKISKIDLVVLESASFNSTNSSTDFQGGYHIIRYLCRRLGIECLEVSPISNKLFFTDNARATKEHMLAKALQKYLSQVDFSKISTKHRYDVADALSLYELGYTYLRCHKSLNNKSKIKTSDLKYYDTIPLYKKQVIANLYGREDLVKEIKKQRNKLKRLDKK